MIRELAAEPGTLFYRLLTDPLGKLLEATEIGRFPSRKLRIALDARDGLCAFPTCGVPVSSCDADHVIPSPRGPTSAENLRHLCRRHHRRGHLPARSARGKDLRNRRNRCWLGQTYVAFAGRISCRVRDLAAGFSASGAACKPVRVRLRLVCRRARQLARQLLVAYAYSDADRSAALAKIMSSSMSPNLVAMTSRT